MRKFMLSPTRRFFLLLAIINLLVMPSCINPPSVSPPPTNPAPSASPILNPLSPTLRIPEPSILGVGFDSHPTYGFAPRTGWTVFSGFKNSLATIDFGVTSVFRDKNGNLWLAVWNEINGGRVYRFDGINWQVIQIPKATQGSYDVVKYIIQDNKGDLWFGTTGDGVYKYNGVELIAFTVENGALTWDGNAKYTELGNRIWAMYKDNSGYIWTAYTDKSVNYYDGEKWRHFTVNIERQGRDDTIINSIFHDSKGRTWFSSLDGLAVFDGHNWRTFNNEVGLGSVYFWGVTEDKTGNIWVGTEGLGGTSGGISRYDGQNWKTFTREDGLDGNVVNKIIEDDKGDLWCVAGWNTNFVGGGVGGGQKLHKFYEGKWHIFTDDLPSNKTVRTLNFKDKLGNLWFITKDFDAACFNPG